MLFYALGHSQSVSIGAKLFLDSGVSLYIAWISLPSITNFSTIHTYFPFCAYIAFPTSILVFLLFGILVSSMGNTRIERETDILVSVSTISLVSSKRITFPQYFPVIS